MSAVPRPVTTTPAQQRLVDEVLAWGQERPRVPAGAVAELRSILEDAAAGSAGRSAEDVGTYSAGALASEEAGAARSAWRHDRETVRGLALKGAFARDVEHDQADPPSEVAAAALAALARERPGDPASASHWLNAQGREVRRSLRDEVASVLADLRSLWPPLPRAQLELTVAPRIRIPVAGGRIVLTARPDLIVDSRHRDDHARALVLVTRAGMPRPVADRALARVHALFVALWSGRVPFRWGSLHLTDGRIEIEDLDLELLRTTARTVGERIATSDAGRGGPASTVAPQEAAADEGDRRDRG